MISDQSAAPSSRQLTERLSDSERAKLRLAIQDVWTSGDVKTAREELQKATQAFRASLKAAIDAQDDPELKRVMVRLLAERYAEETRGARPALRPAAKSSAGATSSQSRKRSAPKKPSPLDEKEQKILQRARDAALQAPEVMAALQERETAIDHRSKMVAAGNYRKAMRAAMLRLEPNIAKVFEKLEASARR